MARINLLPWRAERRKHRQKEFFGMLGAAAVAGVLISFLIITFYARQISGQESRNSYLQSQIDLVQKQLSEIKQLDEKKAKLLKRKEIIEKLQSDRSQMVHLFDSLVRTIPDGVVLTSIKQEGEKLTLQGRTQSTSRVSTYMRNLEGSGWMTNPQLAVIEAKAGDAGLPFTYSLSVTLANPNPSKADGATDGAAPATAPATPAAPAAMPATNPATPGAAS